MSQNYEIDIQESAEEIAARQNRLRTAAIELRFKEIDSEKIRCISDIALEKPDGYGRAKLVELEAEAVALRTELAQMNGG